VFKWRISIRFTQRSSAPLHQSGIWQCAKSSSRLRSPAYSRFIIPLQRRLMLFASPKQTSLFIILDDSCFARPLKQHTEKPRPPFLCDSAFETSLKSLPVDMRTVASAAGYVRVFATPSPGWSISLKTRD
jgi:hypothetical protein